ncbi:hypothetical protein SUVC_04G5110 [Saccharomyces uvarum]|uniref:VOC domain-containing protein n=1 Tax=Saccharomyces uvarum TaxID=230603 RepID=A0AA35JH59_SACUV|nr:hypothetical protein SUVC_04G5110 [Saccharomyces uvarum]
MNIARLDHLVLTVTDIQRSCDFYERVLGFGITSFEENRKALTFGNQKINLHEAGKEFEPKAKAPIPGSADLCFIAKEPLDDVVTHLRNLAIPIEEGPVVCTGATSSILSVYIRDPDENLIEISNEIKK